MSTPTMARKMCLTRPHALPLTLQGFQAGQSALAVAGFDFLYGPNTVKTLNAGRNTPQRKFSSHVMAAGCRHALCGNRRCLACGRGITQPSTRSLSTRHTQAANEAKAELLRTKDRGPVSQEETQTDFETLDVFGSANIPSTSVDICYFDGFKLDSGLRITEGDGVMLVGAEAFVWRPWMAAPPIVAKHGDTRAQVVTGEMLRQGKTSVQLTGGVINSKGQFEAGEAAWGLLRMVWPKPDLLIVGTGPTIRPLAPSTKAFLQQLGVRVEVLDTRNAASQFNMLATERGLQEVAAALVPIGFGSK